MYDLRCKANYCFYVKCNTRPKWLRKSESFMTVTIEVNLIKIDSKAQGTKKAYLLIGVREMRLGKRV